MNNLTDSLSKVTYLSPRKTRASLAPGFVSKQKLNCFSNKTMEIQRCRSPYSVTWWSTIIHPNSQMFSENKNLIFICFSKPSTVSCVYPIRHTSFTNLTATAHVHTSLLACPGSLRNPGGSSNTQCCSVGLNTAHFGWKGILFSA